MSDQENPIKVEIHLGFTADGAVRPVIVDSEGGLWLQDVDEGEWDPDRSDIEYLWEPYSAEELGLTDHQYKSLGGLLRAFQQVGA